MYTALRALSPDFLDIMFTLIDDGFCTCQIVTNEAGQPVDYRFLQTNAYFERMTGLSDPVGKTALELVPNLESHWIETYGAVALDRVPRRFQQGSEAMGRWFDVFATPIEPHGHFAIVFRDTTPLRSAEAERAKALERAENLLLELNHRVMNSLGMISSIIALESRQHSDGDAARALERIRGRVQALADLYRSLNAAASVNAVSARDYIGAVVSGLRDSVATNAALTVLSEIDEIDLCTRTAVPLGLIVNELVTNSLKYAFRPEEPGVISVVLRDLGGELSLEVRDNGRGIGDAPGSDSGVGQRLVKAFIRQLEGQVTTSSDSTGTRVAVRFRNMPDQD